MRSAAWAPAMLLFAGVAHASPIDWIDGWAHLWGVPETSSWRKLDENISLPIDEPTFRAQMKSINEQNEAFTLTQEAFKKVGGPAMSFVATFFGAPETIAAGVDPLLDKLIAPRATTYEDDRVALLHLCAQHAAGFDSPGGSLRIEDFQRVVLSKEVINSIPKEQREEYRAEVQKIINGTTQQDLDRLRTDIHNHTDQLAAANERINRAGGDIRQLAKTLGVVNADLNGVKRKVDELRQAQAQAFSAATGSSPQVTALTSMTRTASDLAQITKGLSTVFKLAGWSSARPAIAKAQVGFATLANVGMNLVAHNPIGAAVSLISGIGDLFGNGRDAWKEQVSAELTAIRQELTAQRAILVQLLASMRVLSAAELSTQQLMTVEQEINQHWFKKLSLDIGSVHALFVDAELKPYLGCLAWIDTQAGDPIRLVEKCIDKLKLFSIDVRQQNGDVMQWPRLLLLDTSAMANDPNLEINGVAQLLGQQTVYREMIRGCWASASCKKAVMDALPDEIRAAGDFTTRPLVDPNAASRIAEGADALFDFFAACTDPDASAAAFTRFAGVSPYRKSTFPSAKELRKRCARIHWQEGVGGYLRAIDEVLETAIVQQNILSGEYLAEEVATQLSDAAALTPGTFRLQLPAPPSTCGEMSPQTFVDRAVADCQQKGISDCEVVRNLANGQAIQRATLAQLEYITRLEAGRLCDVSGGGRSLLCLLDLNRTFAANAALHWVRHRVAFAKSEKVSQRLLRYDIAYHDPRSCAALWEDVAAPGILVGARIAADDYVASGEWSSHPSGDNLLIRNGAQDACSLERMTTDPDWGLRIFEPRSDRCELTTMPLPSPSTVHAGLDFATRGKLAAIAARRRIQDRLGVLQGKEKTEKLARERLMFLGRIERVQAAAR